MASGFRLLGSTVLILLAFSGTVYADPGAVVWSGGTVRLVEEHRSVRLVSEKIIIEPDIADARITVLLQFENRGDATSAAMGFPTVPTSGRGYYFVRGFNVDVDGEPLESTRERTRVKLPEALGSGDALGAWFLFRVPFAAQARRSMRIRYRLSCSNPGYDATVSVPYILFTGATWHGPIERVELEVRLGDVRNYHGLGLQADGHPRKRGRTVLEHTLRDDRLLWQAENYTGTPGVLWFTASRGPARLEIDGEGAGGGHDPIRWHHGQLLTEAEFLADLLCGQLQSRSAIYSFATLRKEGRKVPLQGAYLRTVDRFHGKPSHYRLFVDPYPALAAFDGTLDVDTDAHGYSVARFSRFQRTGAATAIATALAQQQELKYRLRCLNVIAQRWPEQTATVCETLCTRPREHAQVLCWAMGACADSRPTFAAADAVIPRLDVPAGTRIAAISEVALATQDDQILRGAALVLGRLDATAVRDRLVGHISDSPEGARWDDGRRRGRNAGLVLRLIRAPAARETLVAAVGTDSSKYPSRDAMQALGFLGDDQALPLLMGLALDPKRKGDVASTATESVGHVRTQAGLEACAQIIERSNNSEVVGRARHALEIATGYRHRRGYGHYVPAQAPDWGRTLSEDAACRLALPLLERLARTPKRHGDVRPCLAYVRKHLSDAAAGEQ